MSQRDSSPIVAALLKPIDGAVDLADEGVVGLLVRGYIDVCLERFQEAVRGEKSQDTASEEIFALASALNAVFLGDSGFGEIVARPWNSPDQLGTFLRDALDLDFAADESVRATLIHTATLLMHVLQGAKGDWEDEVEALVVETRDLLLGRTPDDGEDLPYA